MEMTPAIARLDLTDEELAGLRRQGFVSQECRCGRAYFKLRFRTSSGKQCARYLGLDPALAGRVKQELTEFQAARRMERELRKLSQQAGEKLRVCKEKLAAQLDHAGFHFHGLSIRRTRVRE
jgi:hypothetical protein